MPIPPRLLAVLREHTAEFGTTSYGRLFRGLRSGAPVSASVYCDVWRKVREAALSPEHVDT
ncbi:integrase, partial [Saccharothrix sp. MB29]|nr:integrase [Saccharothrix sp. MB29]